MRSWGGYTGRIRTFVLAGLLAPVPAFSAEDCPSAWRALGTPRFMQNFVAGLSGRAHEINRDPVAVEETLKAAGLHEPYRQPTSDCSTKFRGSLVIEGNLQDFFRLWAHYIKMGYGSVNDRLYGDRILQFAERAAGNPLLRYVPMTSTDVFWGSMERGRMNLMVEETTARFMGMMPTSKVTWVYQRTREPTASNSFEEVLNRCNCDLAAVEAEYNRIFDPKRLDPSIRAKVRFKVEPAEEVENPHPSDREFHHHVHVPWYVPFRPVRAPK